MNRRLIFALLLCALPAGAQPWRARVEGPRGLPGVEVSLGYPHGLVSTERSPITLRIRTGSRPFDGYVGFHIGERKLRTIDSPVITRVQLGPNAEQTFDTWARMRLHRNVERFDDREIIIEWRNRSVGVIATRSAGVPPWQRAQPLRLPVAILGTTPQWYAGFSRVETSTDRWFALPLRVREAIFRSTLPVVFAGPPSSIPQMTEIDRALLPVEFRAEAAVVDVPWPYSGNGKQLPVRVSWRADEGAKVAGNRSLSYIAANSIAVFAADERVVREGLPSFTASYFRTAEVTPIEKPVPRPSDIVEELRPLIAATLLVPLSVVTWFLMRRRPRLVLPAILAAAVIVTVAGRDVVQPIRLRDDDTVRRMRQSNVVDVVERIRDTGVMPLRRQAVRSASIVTPLLDAVAFETRPSSALPGAGETYSPFGWTSSAVQIERRELGRPASMRVRAEGTRLTVDYESSQPVDFVHAEWICGAHRCNGTVRADARRGSVVIRHRDDVWSCLECRVGYIEWSLGNAFTGTVFVSLITRTGRGIASISQIDPPGSPARDLPFTAEASVVADGNVLRATFALPDFPESHPLTARLRLQGPTVKASRVVLAGEKGAATLTPDRKASISLVAPVDDIRTITSRGGIVTAVIETTGPVPDTSLLQAQLAVARKQ